MKKHLFASLAVASTIGFFIPLTSQAFGLGKLELMSAMNEPFKAEIEVTALRADEKDNLQVKIAAHDEFEKAGLERSILLSQLEFDIVERAGQTRILVTSKQPVKEPFLDFLLTATAGAGRLIREYTVLLDPPEYVTAEMRTSKKTSAATPAASSQSPAASSKTRYQYAESTHQTATSYGPVERSDTLWNIALKTRPDQSISVHQMMMALLNANPEAFTKENINGLKAGYTLQIPSLNQIRALSNAAAVAAVKEQNQLWKNRNKTAAAASVTQTAEEDTQQVMAEQAEMAAAETKAAEVAIEPSSAETAMAEMPASEANSEGSDARLQLVAPEDDADSNDKASPNAAGNSDINKLTEQLTMAQETIEAQAQENIDFKARMDAMEEQLETMRRLISLKDADLARLQDLLEEEAPELAAETLAQMQSNAVPESAAEQVAAMEATENAVTSEEMAPAVAQQDVISDTAKALNLDEEEVRSVVGQVKQFINEHKLETALGLLLLLLILWLVARRRNREMTWDEAVGKMDTVETVTPVVHAEEAPVLKDDFTDAPLTTQVTEKTVAELVEQADMFVGYADYVQAKNALEQARIKEPDNTFVAYKLLFVLYKLKQTEEFIALAEESRFESDGYESDDVKQWGLELAPGNPLFADDSAEERLETEVNDKSSALALDADEFDAVAFEPSKAVAAESETQQESHIEFNLDDFADAPVENAQEQETQPVKADDVDDDLLSFDTNYGLADKVQAVDEETPLELDTEENSDDTLLTLDLDNEPVQIDREEAGTTQEDEIETTDAPDLEFDIGNFDEIDEAETKLDLAAAYIDMGDPDGARSILNEVLIEGSDEQKNRAHSLIDSLS